MTPAKGTLVAANPTSRGAQAEQGRGSRPAEGAGYAGEGGGHQGSDRRPGEPHLQDLRLRRIARYVGSVVPYESLYLYGSRARGTGATRSDYDMVVVVKTGVYFARYARLFKLERWLKRHYCEKVDLHIAAAAFLRRSRGGYPVRVLKQEGVLVSGRDVLPPDGPLSESVSLRLEIALMFLSILLSMKMTPDGVSLEKKNLSKMLRFLERDSQIVGPLCGVPDLLRQVRALEQAEEVDVAELCVVMGTYLGRALDDLRFSRIDLFLYIFLEWAKRRKRLVLGALLKRKHVTERILKAQVLLTLAAANHPPEKRVLEMAGGLLDDHVEVLNLDDTVRAWTQLRTVVASYWFPAVEAVRFTRDAWFF